MQDIEKCLKDDETISKSAKEFANGLCTILPFSVFLGSCVWLVHLHSFFVSPSQKSFRRKSTHLN